MPDLLGAANPVPGYDIQQPRVTTPQLSDPTVQNIVDPNRVVRPDGQEGQQGQQGSGDSTAARFESNFMTFIGRLRDSQDMADTFLTVLGQRTEISSGIRGGFAQELSEFLDFIRMDEAELGRFLRNQVRSGARFSGPLFALLRAAYDAAPSALTKTDILQFVRRFSDYSSTEHIEDNILRNAAQMAEAMPGKWSAELSGMLARLQNGVLAGDREGNLRLLRDEIFPLVSRYVSATHDHGLARELLSAMTLDVARYENSSEEGLLEALRRLAASDVLPRDLAEVSDAELLRMLKESDFHQAAESDTFAERMTKVTQRALAGEAGAKTQEAFHHIMNAVLINESVYMPLQHIMLPIDWNGRLMFSEIWVDPDAERDSRGRKREGEGQTRRILIKMDVQDLGAFDVLIQQRAEGVSLLVGCPKAAAPFTAQITRSMQEILQRNGLTVEQVQVAEMRRPLTVSQAFPKLFERMSGINVKV